MNSAKSVKAYRSLVRAAKLTFKNDILALKAAQAQIRQQYAEPVKDRADFLQRIQMAKDVAHILRCNVVQGVKNEKGNYKLSIHLDTELGDNDSRYQTNIVQSGESTGCCGGKTN